MKVNWTIVIGIAIIVALIATATVDILLYKKVLRKVIEQEGRIKFLEEKAYIRGDRGRFQKLMPAEPIVPAVGE